MSGKVRKRRKIKLYMGEEIPPILLKLGIDKQK